MQDEIDALYEELIYLDEIAGELDPESNARIDARRAEIKQEIRDLQSLGTVTGCDPAEYHDELERDHDEPYEPETDDNWYDEQYELDTDYL